MMSELHVDGCCNSLNANKKLSNKYLKIIVTNS